MEECRRARDARPYNVAGNCNCEMRLQRWVASLQRLDAFATVGCTAVLCRGAHCAPVSYIAAPVTVITTMLRASARRVIGATAKPLYAIDGKAVGLDRRNPRPPSSREGDRPQAVEGVRTRCFYAEYLFLPTHTGHMKHTKHMKHMKYKSRFFGKTVFCERNSGIATVRCVCNCWLCCCCLENGELSSADDGTRSARPRGLGGDFDLPRSKVATGVLPFAWDAPPR